MIFPKYDSLTHWFDQVALVKVTNINVELGFSAVRAWGALIFCFASPPCPGLSATRFTRVALHATYLLHFLGPGPTCQTTLLVCSSPQNRKDFLQAPTSFFFLKDLLLL
jgi:hypothetical protein